MGDPCFYRCRAFVPGNMFTTSIVRHISGRPGQVVERKRLLSVAVPGLRKGEREDGSSLFISDPQRMSDPYD